MTGDLAYVVSSANNFRVIDVSDPVNPTQVGNCLTPSGADGLSIMGGHAYVATTGGLKVINISDPSDPFPAGSFSTPGMAKAVHVDGGYAFIADREGGMAILDVSGCW